MSGEEAVLNGPGNLNADEPGEDSNAYRVELPVFEGPLDLLLHLIRKHEIDIFDIPIAKILDEYLAYLEWMRALNLDVAGEFLVMASTLAQIKSRLLLPPEQQPEDEEQQPQEDPRAELVRRLLEYQRYQEAAEQLKQRPVLLRDVFARQKAGEPPEPEADQQEPFAEVSLFRLIEALDKVMRKAALTVPHEVIVERISLATRIEELAELLAQKTEVTFEELFGEQPTRRLVVVTFFALLEMTRLKMIRLHQAQDSETIYVRVRQGSFDLQQALEQLQQEATLPADEEEPGN